MRQTLFFSFKRKLVIERVIGEETQLYRRRNIIIYGDLFIISGLLNSSFNKQTKIFKVHEINPNNNLKYDIPKRPL